MATKDPPKCTRSFVGNALLDKPMRPVADRACGDAKAGLLCQAHPIASKRRVLTRKERENGAGATDMIAIIEMIGAGIVEIHCLLDEVQTDDVLIELQVARGLARNCRHVMDASHTAGLFRIHLRSTTGGIEPVASILDSRAVLARP